MKEKWRLEKRRGEQVESRERKEGEKEE